MTKDKKLIRRLADATEVKPMLLAGLQKRSQVLKT